LKEATVSSWEDDWKKKSQKKRKDKSEGLTKQLKNHFTYYQ
jgi:hypothetical protein